jgi:hypothetical protein
VRACSARVCISQYVEAVRGLSFAVRRRRHRNILRAQVRARVITVIILMMIIIIIIITYRNACDESRKDVISLDYVTFLLILHHQTAYSRATRA